MGMRVGPNPVDVRIVEQKDAAEASDYRVEIGFRPAMVEVFSLDDTGAASKLLVSYDGLATDAGAAQGGVVFAGGSAATAFATAAQGIVFEDNGYVLGQDDAIKLDKGHLLVRATGTNAPVADLDEANAVEVLAKGGGFGTGKMFDYDTTPPKYDWIGPTS